MQRPRGRSTRGVFSRQESGVAKGRERDDIREITGGQLIQGLAGIIWKLAFTLSETEGFEKRNNTTQLIF